MSYQVLSRKFRPQRFEDVIGQIHVSRTLKNAIKLDRVAHGYIFSGPRGVGKTTTARILSKAINCNELQDYNPCGGCASCKSITEGRNIDVLEIDGASNRGIDDIRDLRENAKYPPTSGKYRVYIIDEVHMLTKEAFNALLKTLEEPPPFVVFILATTDPHKVPLTILSRTQKFDFKRISMADIIGQLELILKSENFDYDEDCLKLIALKADGGLRDALSMLDQIIAFTESRIDMETVMSVLGMVQQSIFLELLDYLFINEKGNVLRLLETTLSSGIAISDFMNGFNEFIRNCMVFAAGGDNTIRIDESTQHWLDERNERIGVVDLMRILDMSLKFETGLKYLQHPRIGLETLLLKIASMDPSVEISNLLQQLSQSSLTELSPVKPVKKFLETKLNVDVTPKTETVSEPSVSLKEVSNPVANTSDLSVEIIQSNWNQFLEQLESVSVKLSHLLEDSQVLSFEKNIVKIQIPARTNGFKIKSLEKDSRTVERVLKTHFKQAIKVKYLADGSGENGGQLEKKTKIKGVEEHPLSLYLIEKFEGELIR
ncbi:MAG: DNA polymerase III subunit gamma/tau [Candidatus Marinimicrobia bacterium]|nr:DNA polymerase III subunit gamma/tau [Candidatus Neomarinimicrobiota bacterium]